MNYMYLNRLTAEADANRLDAEHHDLVEKLTGKLKMQKKHLDEK
uniref:Transcriptional regulator n=1 Tax=Heterorhabditis bacteriophora TaxID=37862 RepID=A0A1I7XH98_HETBA